LAGRAEGKMQLGRPMNGLEANNEIDLTEMGQEVVNWMHKGLRSSRMLFSTD
jgi:hypothetical protein